MKNLFVGLFVGTLLTVQASANEALSDFDRFTLWNSCNPLGLHVEVIDLREKAQEIGLTTDRVETLVRSRMRAARIYDEDGFNYVLVHIQVIGGAYSLYFALGKYLYDSSSNTSSFTSAWRRIVTGVHGGSSEHILSVVSEGIDEFVDEYLRVNSSVC